MITNIGPSTVDTLIDDAWANIRNGVEGGVLPASSESTLRFLFAWELGRGVGFTPDYRFDFEWSAYSSLDTEDRFLDLLVYTNPAFKVAIELKLPKSSGVSPSAHTYVRALVCRDISRLSYLVRGRVGNIGVGYFLCATDEGAYLVEGRKHVNPHYRTYHGTVYKPGVVLPRGTGANGIDRELVFPKHEVRFEWEGIEEVGVTVSRLRPKGRFAWLKPIRIAA